MKHLIVAAGLLAASSAAVPRALGAEHPPAPSSGEAGPADRLLAALIVHEPTLAVFVEEVLVRNPMVAAQRAAVQSAGLRAPQVASLPDPVAGLTAFVASPETRVGPQRFTVTLAQRFPWFGTLDLREQQTLRGAAALGAGVEAHRLELVTEARRLYHEIAFLDALAAEVQADRETLLHYEQLARARYASGVGTGQGAIKIQAEITKDDNRLLDIAHRRAGLVAGLNALRDRPADSKIPGLTLLHHPRVDLDPARLRARALAARPELARADAEIGRADAMIELAHKAAKPELTLGVAYTNVGERNDLPGQIDPPQGNGSDIFAVSATLNLPLRRGRLRAGMQEAAAHRLAAVELRRAALAAVERALGELIERARLAWQQLRLFDTALLIQAEESLRSAEAGYTAGTLGALDLLDAERVLLEVRTASERAHADYAITLARLEGAVGEPLPGVGEEVSHGH